MLQYFLDLLWLVNTGLHRWSFRLQALELDEGKLTLPALYNGHFTPSTTQKRFYHTKQRCRDTLVMTHIAVIWSFLCLPNRSEQRSWEWRNSPNRLEMEQVLEAEGEVGGGLSPSWTCFRAVQKKPSPVTWLLPDLGNRTCVDKQDCFKEPQWQYQLFFVTQNAWRPGILSSRLDRCALLLPGSSREAELVDSVQSLIVWDCSGQKVLVATHQIYLRA